MNIKHQMRAFSECLDSSLVRFAALAALGLALAGCGGSGADTQENPDLEPPDGSANYGGPLPATAEVQAFRTGFWEPALAEAGCDSCHNAGGQAPTFLRTDDVNMAFQQANTVVNHDSPAQSRLVTKVAGGHNCWKGNDTAACESIMTRWITNWVGASDSGGRQIQLQEPTPVDPGSRRRFPGPNDAEAALFAPIYNKLDEWCSGCHQANSATAQSPYFATGGLPEDTNEVSPTSDAFKQAYIASIPKINLDDPAMSRFVLRLRNEKHNCFNDCEADADELQALIQAMADEIDPVDIPEAQIVSKAVTLYDGTLASGGNRYENNLIALYEFKAGQGAIAADTSGVAPAADLNLIGDVSWVGGYGINVRGGKAQASTTTSRKFHQLITATGEYSIEAWVVPGNVTQEDARIVSYSGSATSRNFTMGQQLYNYEFFARSSATDANGETMLSTDDDAERLQAALQHVVMTFDPINGRRIYVNGEFTGDLDGAGGGTLDSWDNSFAFVLGSEVNGAGKWQGVIRLVAIHNRALNEAQVQQNFQAGVGQKFFLLFGISHIIDVPRSYIVFEAEQYDSFSYLFHRPKYFSLDAQAMPGSIPLQGMRIGVNGAEAVVGQAYRLLDTTINDNEYSAATGQLLSSVGTIIPVEQGPEFDEFFLCFDQLGTAEHVCSEFTPGVPPAAVVGEPASDIGVKLFDAINATMASITGVSPNNAKVKATYASVRQSLPAVHDIKGYLSSHQTSLAQLALQYCNVMMDTPSLRDAFFSGIDYSAPLTLPDYSAVNPNGQAVIDQLHANVVGNVPSQPDNIEFATDMGDLLESLCNPNLPADPLPPDQSKNRACSTVNPTTNVNRTVEVIKAACGAALGSAVTLVQ